MPSRPLAAACLPVVGVATVVGLVLASHAAPARAEAHAPLGTAPAARTVTVAQPSRVTRTTIDRRLQERLAVLMSKSTAAHYGVVVDIAGRGRVASLDSSLAMRPASTQKLFTTLPLLLHEPDRRLVTDLAVVNPPEHGVVKGDLVVRASADPSLLPGDLVDLARQVHRAGIRTVTGHLVLDIGSMPRTSRQQGWKPDFVPWDVGPLSPFPVYEDVWRHDGAYLSHPTQSNLHLFRTKLAAAGIRIRGSSEIVRTSSAGVVVATHRSVTVHALIKHTLRISDNFYAESLLVVGGGHPPVDKVAADAGVTGPSRATDGSGLSYDDRETAAGEVALLRYAQASPAAADLRAALPVACRNGTLQHRFCHTAAAGKVYAKTGTLTHSTALAGYTTDGAGRQVTFSVICSGVRSLTTAMHATDRVVLALRGYSR